MRSDSGLPDALESQSTPVRRAGRRRRPGHTNRGSAARPGTRKPVCGRPRQLVAPNASRSHTSSNAVPGPLVAQARDGDAEGWRSKPSSHAIMSVLGIPECRCKTGSNPAGRLFSRPPVEPSWATGAGRCTIRDARSFATTRAGVGLRVSWNLRAGDVP